MATATVAARTIPPQEQFTRPLASLPTPNENQLMHLAARLADACVNPSYLADLWAIYHNRFVEVLRAEKPARKVLVRRCERALRLNCNLKTDALIERQGGYIHEAPLKISP